MNKEGYPCDPLLLPTTRLLHPAPSPHSNIPIPAHPPLSQAFPSPEHPTPSPHRHFAPPMPHRAHTVLLSAVLLLYRAILF